MQNKLPTCCRRDYVFSNKCRVSFRSESFAFSLAYRVRRHNSCFFEVCKRRVCVHSALGLIANTVSRRLQRSHYAVIVRVGSSERYPFENHASADIYSYNIRTNETDSWRGGRKRITLFTEKMSLVPFCILRFSVYKCSRGETGETLL